MTLSISDDRVANALHYLAETDQPSAEAKAQAARLEFKAKAIRDAITTRLDGAMALRQSQAGAAPAYAQAMEDYFAALAHYEALRNKRATESIVVEVWRSLNANRRTGGVT